MFQTQMKKGLIRVEYEPPQEIEVDVHFHHIEELVRDFKPKRVVIDSLSTYGSTLGTKGRIFRDFFHALVALMKEHQIVAVYNHENPEMLGMNSMMGDFAMSSLVDNIILMNWAELGDSFRLGLTVAKMRANPVDRVTRECEVINGKGMRVLPRALPVRKLPILRLRRPGGALARATYSEIGRSCSSMNPAISVPFSSDLFPSDIWLRALEELCQRHAPERQVV